MYKYPYNDLTLCSQCQNSCFLSLDKEKPKDILIQCDKCGYNDYTSLHNYLYKKTISKIQYDNNETQVNF